MRPHSLILTLSIMLFLAASCRREQVADVRQPSVTADSLSILFTGDVMLDRGVRSQIVKHGVEWLFSDVTGRFLSADAVVINLECPITDVVTPLNKQFVFRADVGWTKVLRSVGITHAALANNHSNDQGYQGFASTVQCLRAEGIVPLGFGTDSVQRMEPVMIGRGGLKVAVFNAVLLNLENWVNPQEDVLAPNICDAPSLARAIRHYRSLHPDIRIVASLHWGVEYTTLPVFTQRRTAVLLADAGADVIIGHHPHVRQPIERIGHTTVCYSLGNFVFDQRRPDGNESILAEIVVKPDTLLLRSYDVNIRQCRPSIIGVQN